MDRVNGAEPLGGPLSEELPKKGDVARKRIVARAGIGESTQCSWAGSTAHLVRDHLGDLFLTNVSEALEHRFQNEAFLVSKSSYETPVLALWNQPAWFRGHARCRLKPTLHRAPLYFSFGAASTRKTPRSEERGVARARFQSALRRDQMRANVPCSSPSTSEA
jgi:hypothetical protein